MDNIREQLQVFVRRFGLLNSACCESCCGEDVSMVQSHILFEIRRTNNPSIQQVADELGIDITTFSRQIKSLEAKGLVSRRPSEKDRRVSLLRITTKGEMMMERIDSYMKDRLSQIFTIMTPFEQQVVTRSIGLFNESLAKVAKEDSRKKSIACCN
jgi:DNA-binding MarR family transcriptional regulator